MGNTFSLTKRERKQRRYSWDENVDTVLLNFFNFLTYSDKKFIDNRPSHNLVTQALKENFRWKGHGQEKINIIHYAAAKASVDGVQYIIKVGAEVNRKTEGGLTALHFAVVFKNLKVIETLVAFGADINAKAYHNGYAPLHYACRDKDLHTLKKLIQLGADPHVEAENGDKPIDIARKLGSRDMVKVLHFHMEKFTEKEDDELRHEKSEGRSKMEDQNNNMVMIKKSIMVNHTDRSSHEHRNISGEFSYGEAEKIQENYETILDYIVNTNNIINKLFSGKHLSLHSKETLQSKQEREKNEELLISIMRGNKEKYYAFITALKETGNTELVNLLLPPVNASVNRPQVVHVNFTPDAVSSISSREVNHNDHSKKYEMLLPNNFNANGIGLRSNNIDNVSVISQGQSGFPKNVSRVYNNMDDNRGMVHCHTTIPDDKMTTMSMQYVNTAGTADNNPGYVHRVMDDHNQGGVHYSLKTGSQQQLYGTTGRHNLLIPPENNQVRIFNSASGSRPVYVMRHHSVSSGNRRELESRSRRDFDTVSSYTSVF